MLKARANSRTSKGVCSVKQEDIQRIRTALAEPIRLRPTLLVGPTFALSFMVSFFFLLPLAGLSFVPEWSKDTRVIFACFASLLLAAIPGCIAFVRSRTEVLIADATGLRVERHGVIWSVSWSDFRTKPVGFLARIPQPADINGKSIYLGWYAGPRSAELVRLLRPLLIASLVERPLRPSWQYFAASAGFLTVGVLLVSVCTPVVHKGLFDERGNFVWFPGLPILLVFLLGSISLIGSVMPIAALLDSSSKRISANLLPGDIPPTLAAFRIANSVVEATDLTPEVRYRYVAPRTLIRRYRSGAAWIAVFALLALPLPWASEKGFQWEGVLVGLILGSFFVILALSQRNLEKRWQAVAFDEFQVDRFGNLTVYRNRHPQAWGTRKKRVRGDKRDWGAGYDLYEANGERYYLDTRYAIPIETRKIPL